MLKIVHTTGDDSLARVFVAELEDGARIECVESVQPPVPREEKWVLIVSTLKGCPVGCPICDAGDDYAGKLSAAQIQAQIDWLIQRRFPDGDVAIPKLKIQFARMGDPAFNRAVLEVLEALPSRYPRAGLLPSISSVAPVGCETFFDELIEVKNEFYGQGRFQMQFSVHTTDDTARRRLIPVRTWSLAQMADYGQRFFRPGDRKITLNFAPAISSALDERVLRETFDPERFLIKLTPINPTDAARQAGLVGLIDPANLEAAQAVAGRFRDVGFETLLSIGELRENEIGSNCGMYVTRLAASKGDCYVG